MYGRFGLGSGRSSRHTRSTSGPEAQSVGRGKGPSPAPGCVTSGTGGDYPARIVPLTPMSAKPAQPPAVGPPPPHPLDYPTICSSFHSAVSQFRDQLTVRGIPRQRYRWAVGTAYHSHLPKGQLSIDTIESPFSAWSEISPENTIEYRPSPGRWKSKALTAPIKRLPSDFLSSTASPTFISPSIWPTINGSGMELTGNMSIMVNSATTCLASNSRSGTLRRHRSVTVHTFREPVATMIAHEHGPIRPRPSPVTRATR